MENFFISNFNRSSKSKPTNRRYWSAANHAQNVNILPFTRQAKLPNADTHTHRKIRKCGKSFVYVFISYRLSVGILLFFVSVVGKLFWRQNRECVSAFQLWIYLFFAEFQVHCVRIRYNGCNIVTAVLLQINWELFILLTKIS